VLLIEQQVDTVDDGAGPMVVKMKQTTDIQNEDDALFLYKINCKNGE